MTELGSSHQTVSVPLVSFSPRRLSPIASILPYRDLNCLLAQGRFSVDGYYATVKVNTATPLKYDVSV